MDTIVLPLRELFLLVQTATQHMPIRAQHRALYTMGLSLQEQFESITDAMLTTAGFPVDFEDADAFSSDDSE
jgi:hypothetical protein